MLRPGNYINQLCSFFLAGILALSPISNALAQKNKSTQNTKLTDQQKAIHLLDRLTFGPRPGDVENVMKMGWEAYLDQQLHPEKVADDAIAQKLQPLTSLNMSNEEIAKVYEPPPQVLQQIRDRIEKQNNVSAVGDEVKTDEKQKPQNSDALTDPAKRRELVKALAEMGYKPRQTPVLELQQAKILRAVYSERQLQEVLTDFWFNHFNVFAQKGADRVLLTSYEREAIRPNVFGKFEDLLLATAKSPAMLFYLDNWLSTSPNAKMPDFNQLRQMRQNRNPNTPLGQGRLGRLSTGNVNREMRQMEKQEQREMKAAQRQDEKMAQQQRPQAKRSRGINENYAREIMELHTLGVDGGYTQKDVQEVARCFTGWTLRQPRNGGGFYFAPFMHDDGEKVVLGNKIPAGGGQRDGESVIKMLAKHPSTAKYLSTKLARKFVADNPPQSLIDRLSHAYLKSDGDLRIVYKTLFTSPEFWSAESYRAKIKTPFEMTVSAARALGAETNGAIAFHRWIQQMGEGLYLAQPPTGYKDEADVWVNTGALLERMNFALALSGNKIFGTGVNFAPELKSAKPKEVADYFVKNILHGNISAGTRATLDKTLSDPQIVGNNGTDVAKIAGLILGSPEFQRQ
ncbi:MAG: DUF1800 domain-containing protein [Acidobacteria bacterium]|nr:DUF1800 domain-containing protein [Acidobacteriota bacterium]